MKIKIVDKKENPFFKRDKLSVEIAHDGESTPGKAALQQILSKELSSGHIDVERIDIRNIFSETGMAKSMAKVFVWNEKKVEDLSKAEKKKGKANEKAPEEKK